MGNQYAFGVGSLVVSGGTQTQALSNLTFSNSPTVTFGLNGPILTASAAGGAGGGSVNFSAGTTSSNLDSVVFSNSNGISFGLNASTITGSHNALTSQSNQVASAANGSFAFQTITFSNANGVSFGTSAGSAITASIATSLTNVNLSAGTTSNNLSAFVFSNSNNVSFGLNGSTVTATATVATSLSNIRVSAGTTSNLLSAFTLSNSNGISFGLNASTITGSHNGLTTQTNQQMTLFATSNTTQSSTGTTNASSIIFAGAGIASVGITNGSIVISVPAGALSPVNFSAGTTSSDLGSVVFSNSNGVSFGLNGSTVTASVAAVGGGFTAEGYNPYDDLVQVVGQYGNGSLVIDPQILPNFQFDRLIFGIQNTNSSNSSGSHTLSFRVGLYTRNASTLSLFSSWSGSTAVTHSGTAGSYSLYSGNRLIALTQAAATITEGKYWVAFVSSTASGGTNGSYSNMMVSNINTNFSGVFGSATNGTNQPKLGQGNYSAATNGIPSSIGFSQIQGTNSLFRRFPVVGFGSGTV